MQMNFSHYASLFLKETPSGQRIIGSETNTRRQTRFVADAAHAPKKLCFEGKVAKRRRSRPQGPARGIRRGRVLKVQHRNLGGLSRESAAEVGRRSSSGEAANHRRAKDACIRNVCEYAHE